MHTTWSQPTFHSKAWFDISTRFFKGEGSFLSNLVLGCVINIIIFIVLLLFIHNISIFLSVSCSVSCIKCDFVNTSRLKSIWAPSQKQIFSSNVAHNIRKHIWNVYYTNDGWQGVQHRVVLDKKKKVMLDEAQRSPT